MRGVEQIPWAYDAILWVGENLCGLLRWRQWLVGGARGRVLDLGCGTGRNLPFLGEGVRAVGVDPSREALERARRRGPGVPLVRARAEALPFKPGVFDTVLSGLVFCSVADVPQGLAEAARVLAGDGSLRMLEHVRSTSRWGARFQDFLQPAWTCVAGGCHNNRDTEGSVQRSGFVIEAESRRASGTTRRFVARMAPADPRLG